MSAPREAEERKSLGVEVDYVLETLVKNSALTEAGSAKLVMAGFVAGYCARRGQAETWELLEASDVSMRILDFFPQREQTPEIATPFLEARDLLWLMERYSATELKGEMDVMVAKITNSLKEAAPETEEPMLPEDVARIHQGMTAYADHVIHIEGPASTAPSLLGACRVLGKMQTDSDLDANDLLGLALEIGKHNLAVIEALDRVHVETFGQPTLTPVPCRPRPGKCILITGHDLKDMQSLLEITDSLDISVYTHGEMIPGHAYPKLHEHKSLYGNFGTAWQNQRKEFPTFPGPMLFTTNCIQMPRPSYVERVFTTGRVAFPDCQHLEYGKWQPLIDAALAAPGFTEEECMTYKDENLLVGAHHATVLSLAGTILDLVGKGAIKHFWFIGGCDGAKPGRNYFSKLAMNIPDDHVILTGACGRFRINRLKDYGDIEGIPRLLDVGQCNDVYSAIRIAMGLAEALKCDINDLPLSLVVSWYEQKAVVQLLTLLHLGLKNIKLGPSLPKALSPEVIGVLVDKFGISLTDPSKVQSDIAEVTDK
ncbi:hydroxylamine reductase [Kipferlia bialata]|uniref:Hydroxylamine reductase n=1 Tax=Kipferlia bialata TaxID=797122 RepID=A0A9K3GLA4_9EUKA|nr:hydroxylamine reductase [Kipferlia bialata]|eukprot:g9057.t1